MYATDVMGTADEIDLPTKPTQGDKLIGFPCQKGLFLTCCFLLP